MAPCVTCQHTPGTCTPPVLTTQRDMRCRASARNPKPCGIWTWILRIQLSYNTVSCTLQRLVWDTTAATGRESCLLYATEASFNTAGPNRSSINALTASLPPPSLPRSCNVFKPISQTTLNPFRIRTRDNATYAIWASNMCFKFTTALFNVMPFCRCTCVERDAVKIACRPGVATKGPLIVHIESVITL